MFFILFQNKRLLSSLRAIKLWIDSPMIDRHTFDGTTFACRETSMTCNALEIDRAGVSQISADISNEYIVPEIITPFIVNVFASKMKSSRNSDTERGFEFEFSSGWARTVYYCCGTYERHRY